MATDCLTIPGKDSDGKPRQRFADKLAAASSEEFLKIAEQAIWLSAYANNNPRSDFHWQADACWDEAHRRGQPGMYQMAWERAAGRTD